MKVGGHRSFHPSILAKELSDFDVINIGAAATFIVMCDGKPWWLHSLA
jgi:hypothetical protein